MKERRENLIKEFDITNISLPEVSFRVLCSKGTYIRTLADDFGRSLGTGAYLKELRRTKIGDYKINDAIGLEELLTYENNQ
jgi:tRNA pseudouridine55 synthase